MIDWDSIKECAVNILPIQFLIYKWKGNSSECIWQNKWKHVSEFVSLSILHFWIRKIKISFWLISFFYKEVKLLRVCKDFSIYPNRKLIITPHRCNTLFPFFKSTVMNSCLNLHIFISPLFSWKASYTSTMVSFKLWKVFFQECPFLKESFSG